MHDKPSRDELLDWDRRHYWHAFTQLAEYEPLVIERAEGCRLFDIDGRSYLDGASSMWCNVHGHRHPRIDAAVREQLDRVAHCTSLGMGCDTTVQLASGCDLAAGDLIACSLPAMAPRGRGGRRWRFSTGGNADAWRKTKFVHKEVSWRQIGSAAWRDAFYALSARSCLK
jgi:hypothetical protein